MKGPGDSGKKKAPEPTGIPEIDQLATISPCSIQAYVAAVSAYVRNGATLGPGPKKAAQIRLSNGLARALVDGLVTRMPGLRNRLAAEERNVAGALRTARADVSQSHHLDGLRLAVELKPVNLAVGRAIWNRFGDIRTFAVNIHLKFPFAVVGGVLVVPIYEETGTKAARQAEREETAAASGETDELARSESLTSEAEAQAATTGGPAADTTHSGRKSTVHLIERAIARLIRAGGRRSEADAPHLLEAIAVVVYDPDTGDVHPDLPKAQSGLRWDEFLDELVAAYRSRFLDE